MKALSLRQPWAWLVVHGGKDVENRRWNTKVRGEFLIHAAKGMTRDEYFDAVAFAASEQCWDLPPIDELDRGGIVGIARLVDVIPPRNPFTVGADRRRWHMPEQFGFVLADVRPLPFRPCRGALGFFEPRSTP